MMSSKYLCGGDEWSWCADRRLDTRKGLLTHTQTTLHYKLAQIRESFAC